MEISSYVGLGITAFVFAVIFALSLIKSKAWHDAYSYIFSFNSDIELSEYPSPISPTEAIESV